MARPELITKITIVILLTLLVYGAPLFGEGVLALLEFNRPLIESGEYYRVLTAHFVHFGWYHTIFNSLGLFAVGYLLLWRAPMLYWLCILIFCPILVSLGMLMWNPEMDFYRGFSGAFYGLLVIAAYLQFKINWRGSVILSVLIMLKIGYEQMPNYDKNYLIDHIGVPVMVDAHLYGALAGLIIVVFDLVLRQALYKKQH